MLGKHLPEKQKIKNKADTDSKVFRFSRALDDDFFSESWTRNIVHFPAPSTQFAEVFGWSQFGTILEAVYKALQPPSITMVRNGASVPNDAYMDIGDGANVPPFRQISSQKVKKLCDDGATLIVNGVERFWMPLEKLTKELSSMVGERVQANAYYTRTSTPGFNLHYDTHEVFVLQVGGSKLWQIGETSYPHPLRTQFSSKEKPPTQRLQSMTIHQGEMLYLPRGRWHSTLAVSGPSLHLSIGVHCRTRLDFLSWLINSLSDEPTLRENLHQLTKSTDPGELAHVLQSKIAEQLNRPEILEFYDQTCANLREGPASTFDFFEK